MSLDISPNGQTIVFDLLGDLYTIPITGGKARRLTSGMAFNQQPQYSPDGRRIAFVSDRGGSSNLWIADSDGGRPWQLSTLKGAPYGAVTSPAWSPDGSSIVVSQIIGATHSGRLSASQQMRWLLASYDVRTRAMRWISDTAAHRVRSTLGATFGTDPQRVYAAIDGMRSDFFSEPEDWRIASVDTESGHIRPLMSIRAARIGVRPIVSPDGRYLVYGSSSGSQMGLRLRDLHSDAERWLVLEIMQDAPLATSLDARDQMPGYAFTPDSRFVIAAFGGKIRRISVSNGRVSIIPFRADIERGLGPLTVHQFNLADSAVRARAVMQPAMSPDGRRVAFSALDRIWLMDLREVGAVPAIPYRATADSAVGEFYPSWSPDGTWISYSTWIDGVGGAVHRVPVMNAGARPGVSERLTSDKALYFHTAVSPDGQRIVAVRASLPSDRALTIGSPAHPKLVWVPSAGGSPLTITDLRTRHHGWYHERYPADQLYFSGDPDRIYIGLTSWNWQGGDQQVALTVTGLEGGLMPFETAGVLSPDRSRALIARRSALFELSLPVPAHGPADSVDLERARTRRFGTRDGAAHRWNTALAPWVSWSRDGRRVLFNQGGTLFIGDVTRDRWTTFVRVDVPIMVPLDEPKGTLALRGARLITMREKEIIARGTIVVRNNRIAAIGALNSVEIPEDATVIELFGKTILPGYVDIHDHPRLPKGIHPQQCWRCLAALAYGVTASRDPQPSFGVDVFTYQERERTGDLLGPRLFSTGIAYSATDPPIQNIDDARDAVRPNADYFSSETFKIYPDPSTGRRARQLLAMALSERRLNATMHQQGAEIGLSAIIDGFSGLEHPFPMRIYDDVATLLAISKTTHTQTYAVSTGYQHMLRRHGSLWSIAKMRRFAPYSVRGAVCDYCGGYAGAPELGTVTASVRTAGQIESKGGNVGLGSHGDLPGLGPHYEMWHYALGGMPEHAILRSATMIGAAAIGHAKDLGSLEPGKLADLQVLDGNPLQDIHQSTSIRYVMKNGRLYQADDLTEIWPRKKPLSPIYLWDEPKAPD